MDKKQYVLEKIYQQGFDYEKNMRGCCQATILAVKDFFIIDDLIFKSTNSFSGGIAEGGTGNCGAFLAGCIIFSYFFGRDINSIHLSGSKFKDKQLSRLLREKFVQEYQAEICQDIQQKIFGQSFDMQTAVGKETMKTAGGHQDKCTAVVGKAASWIAEILINQGVELK